MNLKPIIKKPIYYLLNNHKNIKKPIIIFTTRRSGSSWLLNILGAAKGVRTIDQPLDRRLLFYIDRKRLPNDEFSKFVFPKNEEVVYDYLRKIFSGRLKLRSQWNIFNPKYDFFFRSVSN